MPSLTQAAPSLTVVGRDSLDARGMNAGLALAAGCAYVGSRGDAAPRVLDVSDPANPVSVGELQAHPGSTPRELRAVASRRELIVLFYRLDGGPNRLDLYRWSDDCGHPSLAGSYDFGNAAPHEMYLWVDPARPARALVFTAMFGSAGEALTVVDVSDPANPRRTGGWTIPAAYGSGARLHSIALSPDGRTAYLSLWTGGLAVADASDFAGGSASPSLRLLTPPGAAFRTPPGDVHSAVPVPGTSLLLTTDERYPAPYGQGCPFGVAHLVDVSDPARPRATSSLQIAENQPAACAAAPNATWTSHNPTLTAHLALVSWYSGGLQVFGLDDPAHPRALASLHPAGVIPRQRDLELGTNPTLTWSYPILAGGLIWVVDVNQGLYVLRYSGPHQEEVAGAGFAEGNSNLSGADQVRRPGTASPLPAISASTPTAPRLGGTARAFDRGPIAGFLALALAAALLAAVLRRRPRRS